MQWGISFDYGRMPLHGKNSTEDNLIFHTELQRNKVVDMISHKHKCIFVEVPKTGSTSIRTILGFPPRPHLNICQIRSNLQTFGRFYGNRMSELFLSLYLMLPQKNRTQIGEKLFESYYKFGFVRNPWDRVVSLYFRKEGLQMKDTMTFEEFVEWIKYSSSTCIYPVPHTNQLDWLIDPHGNVVVDFIGRFENLQNDWKTISKKLGIEQELTHKNMNTKRTGSYTDFYTEKTKNIIGEKFKIDIEYFGYQFGE